MTLSLAERVQLLRAEEQSAAEMRRRFPGGRPRQAKRTCRECDRPAAAHGLCDRHRRQVLRAQSRSVR